MNRLFSRPVVAILLAHGLVGCTTPPPPPSQPQPPSQLHSIAASTLSAESDRVRQDILSDELDHFVDQNLTFSAKNLSPADQRFLAKLLQAAEVAEELNLLQIHPKMLEYRTEVTKNGTTVDRRVFYRNHGPWCLESDDVRCNALRSQPPKAIGCGTWPEGFTAENLVQLRQSPNNSTLLCPFTAVRRQGDTFEAHPLIKVPFFEPKLRQLSLMLEEAAALIDEPTMKTFLLSRARALLSEEPYPYDESDLEWIKLAGRWEVTVGPYETARDPWGIKARFGMYIGLEDGPMTEQLSHYRKNFQRMENQLARLIGGKLYKPRKMSAQIAIRAIQLIMAAGDARLSRGAIASYHLPMVGKAVKQGLTKKVILINQLRAYAPILVARAKEVLTEEQQKYVTEEALILNSTFHEFCHSFGAYDDLAIVNDKGRSTVAKALGQYHGLMDELKANTLALWLMSQNQKRGHAGEENMRAQYTTAMIQYLGLLQLEPNQPPSQAAGILLGTLMASKAVSFNEASGRWQLNYRAFPRTLQDLVKQISTIQLTGDQKGAADVLGTHVKLKGSTYVLVDAIDRPRLRSKEAFLKAGIKGLSLSYKVADLDPTRASSPAPGAAPAKTTPAKAVPAKAAPEKKPAKAEQPASAKQPARAKPAEAAPAKAAVGTKKSAKATKEAAKHVPEKKARRKKGAPRKKSAPKIP